MEDSLKVENTPTRHRRKHVSGTTQASFLAKFKATQNKLRQKRHHHSVYIYIIFLVNILGRKSAKTQCLPTNFTHKESDNLL